MNVPMLDYVLIVLSEFYWNAEDHLGHLWLHNQYTSLSQISFATAMNPQLYKINPQLWIRIKS